MTKRAALSALREFGGRLGGGHRAGAGEKSDGFPEPGKVSLYLKLMYMIKKKEKNKNKRSQ